MLDRRQPRRCSRSRHVSQSYRNGLGRAGAPMLDDVSLTLDEGEIVGLLGRSGCGKSTLLRIVAGLDPADRRRGHLSTASAIDGPAEGIAMVFQSFALFPWLTVLENVEIGLRAMGVPRARGAPARARGDRPDRPRRLRIRLSEGAVRRHAPARRLCARAGRPSRTSC